MSDTENRLDQAPPFILSRKKARILVADDDAFFLERFKELIAGCGHDCLAVESGLEALEKARDYHPDIILTDVVMPGMDGFEVTRRFKADPLTSRIPVIIVTTLTDMAARVNGLECGADEFLTKPVDDVEFRLRIENILKVKRYGDYLLAHGRMLENEVENKAVQLKEAFEKIRRVYIQTVYRLTLAAEYRDKETGGHIRRISLYSQLLARNLMLSEADVEAIFFASPMHDIGKIGIPDAILLKNGRHTKEESDIMKRHTLIGADILKGSESEILMSAFEIALTHHETWDGKGYPNGLKAEAAPISGRIVHIVDIYDALRTKRPYKNALSHATALRMIEETQESFDPQVFKSFISSAEEMNRLFEENKDE